MSPWPIPPASTDSTTNSAQGRCEQFVPMWCGCRSRSGNRDRGCTVGSAQCTVDGTAASKLREKDTRVCVARSRGVDGDNLRRTHSDGLISDYPACGYTAVAPLAHDNRHRRRYPRMPAHGLDQVSACSVRWFD